MQQSNNIYMQPIPTDAPLDGILKDWPSHTGPYEGAVDFNVPVGTDVLAPFAGTVVDIVQDFDTYGPDATFEQYTNYIILKHINGEFTQLAHIAKNSVLVQTGELVRKGQKLAVTGLNGWMQEPNLEHLHMFVFNVFQDGSFKGVQIQFEEEK